ncbi:PAS domain-containing protein [Paracoccus sp. Z118]|uniref:sensor histidine kinase n=1 Tax=Paracoccus sp. Z118 TaxID=2851017 RepID=UPI001C2C1596|nr:ATP-binding protein [Paracoccus sp. Z118]MBV0890402.1 PAS domain-containing protein [Paracoccus sp. Z118]
MEIRHLRQLADAVPVAMLVVDRRSRVIAANQAANAIFGPSLTDRPFVTVVRHPSVNHALDWVLDPESGPPPHDDPDLPPPGPTIQKLRATLSAQGRDRACVVTVGPLVIDGARGASIAIEDSSGVEQAEQMRRDFVANVSHELRTPLTALMGFIETLRGPARNDPAARDRFLDIMEREANRMNRLVADLLSLSRVEGDERRRPVQDVDLSGMVRSVAATLAPAARNAGVSLDVEKVPTEPVIIAGDNDQILQVFHNLIENAVKYGGSGGVVRLSLAHVPHEPVLRGPGWAVTVADEGEGIDPLHLPRLTERFYRADTHRSREKGGTGLGLAIVKHIINRHRGRLRIESEKGQGSRFTVILPERKGRG